MTTFSDLDIQEDILQGLEKLGYENPTPVQEEIIPLVLQDRADLVALAQTGTGKTAAFGIPLVQLCAPHLKETQGLVLCPTRELCVQVAKDLGNFARFVPGVAITAVYGGARIDRQITSIKKGGQIIVATPGRLNDLLKRKAVNLSRLRSVVLDEADEMLQMGFLEELNTILDQTPKDKTTLLFSATMPKAVATIAGKYMRKPKEITIGQKNAGSENVRHIYYMVRAKDRYNALKRIADFNPDIYSIIFCRTRQETKEVADKLIQDGYSADALHGDLNQNQRDVVMNKFRRKSIQLLVATDVAARGLDVNDLTHVINYNLPDEAANYTHRSGRTGRAGKKGISIAIIHMREHHRIRNIEHKLRRKFEEGKIPSGHEVCEKQLLSFINSIHEVKVDHDRIDPFLSTIFETLSSLEREDLIKRFVSVEFNRFLKYYQNAPDLNLSDRERKGPKKNLRPDDFGKKFGPKRFTRFVLNIGQNDGVYTSRLIGQINDATGLKNIQFGKIKVMENSTLFEAESKFAPLVQTVFENMMVGGKDVKVENSGERTEKPGSRFGNKSRGPGGRGGKTPFRFQNKRGKGGKPFGRKPKKGGFKK